jgi:NAD(P)-dependent dehydrogenase (short-subunit alcohol dehydrogenase family)
MGNLLKGKCAVVTGASAGMGAAIARRFASEGADIWAAGGADAAGLKETIEGCAAGGTKADGRGYDFSRAAAAGDAVREGADFLGGLDILVNCAGGRVFGPLAGISDEDIDFAFELNTKSLIYASREAARIMGSGGHILMMGSVAGIRGAAARSLYCTTKAAVHMLTKCLALELGPLGIRVNCLAPGLVDSGRVKVRLEKDPAFAERRRNAIPLGKLGDPENIAATALFIVSPDNEFMNGTILSIDGGVTAG